MWELLIVLAIVLVIFGAGKLPAIGEAFGKSIRNFKKSSSGDEDAPKNELPAAAKAKELTPGAADEEFEEVVVRRRVKKDN